MLGTVCDGFSVLLLHHPQYELVLLSDLIFKHVFSQVSPFAISFLAAFSSWRTSTFFLQLSSTWLISRWCIALSASHWASQLFTSSPVWARLFTSSLCVSSSLRALISTSALRSLFLRLLTVFLLHSWFVEVVVAIEGNRRLQWWFGFLSETATALFKLKKQLKNLCRLLQFT